MVNVGSGFFVSRVGHVLTNQHVIDGCKNITVKGPRTSVAERVASDKTNDLALLEIRANTPQFASFRSGRRIRQGDFISVYGHPLHGTLASAASITTGVISALAGLRNDIRHVQVTAPVQRGNSGGPLLDASGNVVGVVVAKLDALKLARATGEIPQNVNFAIKHSVALAFLDAHGVDYEENTTTKKLSTSSIADHTRNFTVLIECRR